MKFIQKEPQIFKKIEITNKNKNLLIKSGEPDN